MTIAQSFSTKPAQVIRSKALVERILGDVRSAVDRHAITPGLAVVLVGEDPASKVYVRNKTAQAEACGFNSRQYDLSASTSESELLDLIDSLNADPQVNGILVQLPLPAHIDAVKVTQAILPSKDVDGFHHINTGRLAAGVIDGTLVPCTPAGALLLIQETLGHDLTGKHAVIVGRSNIVGKPMASLLLQQNCSVSIIHSRTAEPARVARLADILVVATGVPELVTAEWVKPGAVVIDVGINRVETANGLDRLVGDVHFESVSAHAHAITPVPGGVGPMTIAMLMRNTLEAALIQTGR